MSTPETKKCSGYKNHWACADEFPDHKVPRSKFGPDSALSDGLQAICMKCMEYRDGIRNSKVSQAEAYAKSVGIVANQKEWRALPKERRDEVYQILSETSITKVSITEHSNVVAFPPVFENSREQVETVTKGRKRDQKVVTHVRKMYDSCSVEGCCYSDFDVAHIHALKHNADDLPSNCLALCPNHHRDLDRGRLQLADPSDRSATDPIMFSFGGWEGRIILNEGHEVNNDHIRSYISEISKFLRNREEQ